MVALLEKLSINVARCDLVNPFEMFELASILVCHSLSMCGGGAPHVECLALVFCLD
jgi:hypothetical protein